MASWDKTRNAWRISARANTPGTGAKRRRVVRLVKAPNTAAGKAEATQEERRLQVAMTDALAATTNGELPQGTFGAAARAWAERARHPKRGAWSPKRKKEVKYALERYILPHLGATDLNRVSPGQVEDMYAAWERAGYQPSAMAGWHSMVNTIFADAARRGDLVGPNPMVRVTAAGGRAPERAIPTTRKVREVIEAAPSPGTRTYFELAAETGTRRGTLLGLRWQDVDTDTGTLYCLHAVAEGEEGPVLKSTKRGKGNGVRLAPEGSALAALREHKARAEETAMALGLAARWRRGDLYVFSNDGGVEAWDVSWPSHAWRKAADKVGVEQRLHDVRHCVATNLRAAGRDTREIADRLGCTEANVQRTYSHRVPGADDLALAEVMARLLAKEAR